MIVVMSLLRKGTTKGKWKYDYPNREKGWIEHIANWYKKRDINNKDFKKLYQTMKGVRKLCTWLRTGKYDMYRKCPDKRMQN